MKFSYDWIKKLSALKASPEKISELLTLKTAEVESIDKTGKDSIMDIKVLPNRGDLMSHLGMAREISALLGQTISRLEYSLNEDKKIKTSDFVSINLVNAKGCRRYTARLMDGLKVGPSPDWLKESLQNLGLRSINNVVDAANFVMLEMGQPIHVFDYDAISGQEIFIRNAAQGETIEILDEAGSQYKLGADTLVIADQDKALAIAGIKGGKQASVGDKTVRILIESANFDEGGIRRTSKELGLRTDASIRFSYGVDANLTKSAVDRCAGLIQELAGGRIYYGAVDVYPKKQKSPKIVLRKDYLQSLIGAKIADDKVEKIFGLLGFAFENYDEKIIVTPPSYRLDVLTEEDLTEEVARIYGYENIKSRAPLVYAFEQQDRGDLWQSSEIFKSREMIKDIFKSLSFSETYNYSFVSQEAKELFEINDMPEIMNPISQNSRYLRSSLLTNLLLAVQRNLRFFDQQRLFETGRIFQQKNESVEEKEELSGIILAPKSFWEIKGSIESLFSQLAIDDYEFLDPEEKNAYLHPNKSAVIKVGEEVIGIMGEISPGVISGLSFKKTDLSAFSIDLQRLINLAQAEREFEPLAKFPSIIRDISLLVDPDVRISQITNIIEACDKEGIIEDIDVFDIFEGQGNSAGQNRSKKSIAFHLIYRAKDRTLSDDEAAGLESEITSKLKDKLSAEIR